MYRDLRQRFWWTRMKREIAQYVDECDVCRRIKAEHQRPDGTLQPLPFPSGNWIKSVWTSSLAFRKPRKETMPSLLSSINSQKLLTSFQFASQPTKISTPSR